MLQYDGSRRVPLWVQEQITYDSLTQAADRKYSRFHIDASLSPPHQSKGSDYRKSGLDRGHMAPAMNHRRNQEELDETFLFSNICPQESKFNRGIWKRLERALHQLVHEKIFSHLKVVSGPLFLPQDNPKEGRFVHYRVIGKNDVAVPTHFFKYVEGTRITGARLAWAYILPNHPLPYETSHENFRVTVEELERKSGILLTQKNAPPIQKRSDRLSGAS